MKKCILCFALVLGLNGAIHAQNDHLTNATAGVYLLTLKTAAKSVTVKVIKQ